MKTLLVVLALLFAVTEVNVIDAADRTISWQDNSVNEDGFKLERNVDGGAFTQLGANIGPNIVITIDATTAVEGSTYCYKLKAFNSAGESGYSNTACIKVAFTIPAAPSNAAVK